MSIERSVLIDICLDEDIISRVTRLGVTIHPKTSSYNRTRMTYDLVDLFMEQEGISSESYIFNGVDMFVNVPVKLGASRVMYLGAEYNVHLVSLSSSINDFDFKF